MGQDLLQDLSIIFDHLRAFLRDQNRLPQFEKDTPQSFTLFISLRIGMFKQAENFTQRLNILYNHQTFIPNLEVE